MILLTIESELDSARRLGLPTELDPDRVPTNETVIRWGNSEMPRSKRDFRAVVNPSKAIRLNCAKHLALETLAMAVDTPRIFAGAVPARRWALIRPCAHTGGREFNVVQGPQDVPKRHYATAWVKTDVEYRVWFAWGRTLCARRVSRRRSVEFPCRSEWGYRFLRRVPARLHADVRVAASAIGLSLGAADVLVKDGRYYFVELNSAPSVDADEIEAFFKTEITRHMGVPVSQSITGGCNERARDDDQDSDRGADQAVPGGQEPQPARDREGVAAR